jgi:hypothetical protein
MIASSVVDIQSYDAGTLKRKPRSETLKQRDAVVAKGEQLFRLGRVRRGQNLDGTFYYDVAPLRRKATRHRIHESHMCGSTGLELHPWDCPCEYHKRTGKECKHRVASCLHRAFLLGLHGSKAPLADTPARRAEIRNEMRLAYSSSPAAVFEVSRLRERRRSIPGDVTSHPVFLCSFEGYDRKADEWIDIFDIGQPALDASEWAADAIRWLPDAIDPAAATNGLAIQSRKRKPGNFSKAQRPKKTTRFKKSWRNTGHHH